MIAGTCQIYKGQKDDERASDLINFLTATNRSEP